MIFRFLLQSKIVRVLNLWQKNGVFKIEVIQPLLDMAAGSSSSSGLDNGPDGGKTLMCNIVNIAVILMCFLFGMRFVLLYIDIFAILPCHAASMRLLSYDYCYFIFYCAMHYIYILLYIN